MSIIHHIGIIVGIVMIILALPLLAGIVPRNFLYGFRIPKAFHSERDWMIINTYGAKALIIWGIIGILFSLFLTVKNVHLSTRYSFITAFIPVFLAFLQTLLFSRKVHD